MVGPSSTDAAELRLEGSSSARRARRRVRHRAGLRVGRFTEPGRDEIGTASSPVGRGEAQARPSGPRRPSGGCACMASAPNEPSAAHRWQAGVTEAFVELHPVLTPTTALHFPAGNVVPLDLGREHETNVVLALHPDPLRAGTLDRGGAPPDRAGGDSRAQGSIHGSRGRDRRGDCWRVRTRRERSSPGAVDPRRPAGHGRRAGAAAAPVVLRSRGRLRAPAPRDDADGGAGRASRLEWRAPAVAGTRGRRPGLGARQRRRSAASIVASNAWRTQLSPGRDAVAAHW